MYTKPIGVSVLTNGQRLPDLQECLGSLLRHCYYRPLVIGVFNNGSTDDTGKWLIEDLPKEFRGYGVEFRIGHSACDLGCATGTNAACEMVLDCEFALHLESDFSHLSPEESGEDRLWLRRAAEIMQEVGGNYLYLRRMTGEVEMMLHWWSQWADRIVGQQGRYFECPNFWWSNNPALIRNKALYSNGTLPLDTAIDGPKGGPGWSQPELKAKAPGQAWIHQYGLFVHERDKQGDIFGRRICGSRMNGKAGCKYGFFKDGSNLDAFCHCCLADERYQDMALHESRYRALPHESLNRVSQGMK